MKTRLMIASLLLLCACSMTKMLTPTEEDVTRASKSFPGLTLEELNKGKSIYESRCGTCHELPKPRNESEAEWKRIVPEMVAKTNKKAGSEVINEADKNTLLRYVITMATR